MPEAALLAGIIKSPNNSSPFENPNLALQRRNTVLGLLLKYRKIDQQTYDQAMKVPLPRKPFREKSGLTSIPFYVDRVLQEMGRDYGVKDVKGRGLQIYTAIDLNAQDAASRVLESGLESLERGSRYLRRRSSPLEGVMIEVDVPTGEIRALVGGRNYDFSQFNRALNAKRQIGSLVKPFVYATAFEPSLSQQNITQATLVSDTRMPPMKEYHNWSPRNYQDIYHGTVTVREALANLKMESIVPGGYLTFPKEYGYQARYLFLVQQNQPDGTSPIVYPKIAATSEGSPANPNCN